MKASNLCQRLVSLVSFILLSMTFSANSAFAVSPTTQGTWPPASFPSNVVHYYVAPYGSDSSTGKSTSSPWLTINHASSSIVVGSNPIVVHVLPGTYKLPACSSSSYSILTNKNGSATAPITFISESRWKAQIIGNSSCLNQWYVTGSYINIWGFDFTGIQTSSNLDSAVIASEGPDGHVDIGYNHIHDLPYGFASAISMEPWGSGTYSGAPCSVHDNVIHDIAYNANGTQTFNNYGMYIACGKTSYVYNNLIYNQGTIGIHLWHAANGVNIFNNTISSNNTEPTNQSVGILVGTGDGGKQVGAVYNVSNNIVVNSYYGIMAEYGSGASISTSSVFQNNLVFNNHKDWYFNANGSVTTLQAYGISVTGTVAGQNPGFVSPSNANYRLASGSKAINAGVTAGAPTRDLDLATRTVPVDIGAYEYGGVSPTPTPTPSPTPRWVKCASEWGTCTFSGTKTVRYGRGTSWTTKTATGSIACNNAVFGDPAYGYAKECDVAQ